MPAASAISVFLGRRRAPRNAQILSGKLMGARAAPRSATCSTPAAAAREDPEVLTISVDTVTEAVYERIERRREADRASCERDTKH